MDSFGKFYEDKLPGRYELYSSLKDTYISEKKYLASINVWNAFKMNTMSDYHDLYLKADVLLLADAFEKFINTCLEFYGLDPCHYFSSLGLSWDAMLKMTKIELEFISDIDKYLFVKKETRGDILYMVKRYSKANNKYMKSYDPNKRSYYITCLDANNLYSLGMSQYLLYGGFKWLNQKEIDKFDAYSIREDSSNGYILEFDLVYPD